MNGCPFDLPFCIRKVLDGVQVIDLDLVAEKLIEQNQGDRKEQR